MMTGMHANDPRSANPVRRRRSRPRPGSRSPGPWHGRSAGAHANSRARGEARAPRPLFSLLPLVSWHSTRGPGSLSARLVGNGCSARPPPSPRCAFPAALRCARDSGVAVTFIRFLAFSVIRFALSPGAAGSTTFQRYRFATSESVNSNLVLLFRTVRIALFQS
jgi:hypothetical protein